MRIWDIIDKIQPGVEVTTTNERPVKIATRGSRFVSLAAGILIATTSVFCMPVPRKAMLTSAERNHAKPIQTTPPLEQFVRGEGFSIADEAALLAELEDVEFKGWNPSEDDVRRAIFSNLSENPGEHVAARSAKFLKRRKLA